MHRRITRQGLVCLLLVLLLGGAWPSAAGAEQLSVSRQAAGLDRLCLETMEPVEELEQEHVQGTEPLSEARLALMSMFLMIGDVPMIVLNSTGAGGTYDPTTTITTVTQVVEPDSTSVTTPSETPEPSAWLLAAVGGAVAASGAWLRRRWMR